MTPSQPLWLPFVYIMSYIFNKLCMGDHQFTSNHLNLLYFLACSLFTVYYAHVTIQIHYLFLYHSITANYQSVNIHILQGFINCLFYLKCTGKLIITSGMSSWSDLLGRLVFAGCGSIRLSLVIVFLLLGCGYAQASPSLSSKFDHQGLWWHCGLPREVLG